MRRNQPVVLVAAAVLGAGCAAAPKRECVWESPAAARRELCVVVNRGDLKAATRRAQAAARNLDSLLMADLVTRVDRHGHAPALRQHADRARAAADETAVRFGFALGRTSDRPRHAGNAAPPWAEPFVEAAAGKRTGDVSAVAVDLGGAVGVLVPVRARASCLRCHGAQRDLAPGVAEELAATFPEDRATGFAPGEHLGWVWAVGVPEDEGSAGDARF